MTKYNIFKNTKVQSWHLPLFIILIISIISIEYFNDFNLSLLLDNPIRYIFYSLLFYAFIGFLSYSMYLKADKPKIKLHETISNLIAILLVAASILSLQGAMRSIKQLENLANTEARKMNFEARLKDSLNECTSKPSLYSYSLCKDIEMIFEEPHLKDGLLIKISNTKYNGRKSSSMLAVIYNVNSQTSVEFRNEPYKDLALSIGFLQLLILDRIIKLFRTRAEYFLEKEAAEKNKRLWSPE